MALARKSLDPDVLFRVPSIYNFDVSPRGDALAFSWNKSGQWEVYLRPLTGESVQQLTNSPESKISPAYSPDGKELAYMQDYQGDENFDIFLLDLAKREPWNLTPETDEAIYPRVRWSPDGRKLAFASNREKKFNIYTMPASGGEPERISNDQFSDSDPEWSPDGKWIAFNSLVSAQDYAVFVARADGGEVRRLTKNGGPIEASSPEWSPDGKLVAFMSAEKGSYDIGIWNIVADSTEWVTDGRHECSDPKWVPDGRKLAYLQNDNGNVRIAIWDRETRKTEIVQVELGVHAEIDFGSDPVTMFCTFSGPRHPPDLWMVNLRRGEFRQLTDSLPPTLDRSSFVNCSSVSYRSKDGMEIPALVYLPKGFDRSKAASSLVYIHGGPTSQQMNEWYPSLQHLVSRGYVVIAPNYRGSTGYGRKFREANRYTLGDKDLEDVVAAAEYLIREGLTDRNRVGVLGGSYGGYLTMCALTKYPKMWAAGVATVPFLNWFTEIENEREDLQFWDRENMGDPKKNYERFHDASPIFFLDSIEAPVQLIGGANDPRCPISETRQAKEQLEKLGKVFDLVIYQDEGHGFRKLNNRVDAYKRRAEFLDKYVAVKS